VKYLFSKITRGRNEWITHSSESTDQDTVDPTPNSKLAGMMTLAANLLKHFCSVLPSSGASDGMMAAIQPFCHLYIDMSTKIIFYKLFEFLVL